MSTTSKKALKRIEEAKRKNSTKLDLSGCELTEFPSEIFELTNLTVLDLYKNNLTKLPDSIGQLTQLTSLILSRNQLNALPKFLGQLTQLTSLNLSSNQLTDLPECLGQLTRLKELELSYNLLNALPESLGRLTQLQKLIINDNQLIVLPDTFSSLVRLRTLNLVRNKITFLPKFIEQFKQLRNLYLTVNPLMTIPDWIWQLSNLQEITIGNVGLTIISEKIGNLRLLRRLALFGNLLQSIPPTLAQIEHLESLDLSDNQLTTLPESLVKLTNLTQLHLNGNKFNVGAEVYELPPQEQIREILKWQRAQREGTLQPIHEAKVIFIGESDYGKTHLIELLTKGEIKRQINTTHGIERSQINIPYNEKDIRLNIWDLGGQKFMRSTHQFFFSERTLYVLVTLARRERNELNHWLKLVNQLGNNAPVLVVINKIDKDPHDLDRISLERDYPNIIGFVRTCIYDCDESKAADTIECLKNRIISAVSDKNIMPGVFEKRLPEWFTVKEQLEKLEAKKIDFITYKDYENLKFIKKLPPEERKSNLKLLSMIGVVVSYVDDPRLIDTNVINPQWIMDGVYAIINDPTVKDKRKGRLLVNELERILPGDRFPKERHGYLLELMQKFNLCYAAKDERNLYLIPDLFEDIEPEFDWDSEKSLHFRYNYDEFSPDTFITRFIVEMNHDIQNENLWRSGVHISNGSCEAKVYQAFRKNHIHIEVLGTQKERRRYLYAIRETFRKLHKPFPQMPIKQEVLYKDYWLDYLELVELENANETQYHTKLKEKLPITDILNGYSTPMERRGTLRTIRIFLASSSELKTEREQFEIFINRENNRLIEEGIYLKLQLWEDFIDAMSKTRLQNEYNNVVKNSDIFVSLFFTKVGKYTREEFETAFGQFKEKGRPLVYTYFKHADINTGSLNRQDSNSLFDFKDKLKELGHFPTVYKNIDDLKLQFKNQLEKELPNL